jgi:hypothetical protein
MFYQKCNFLNCLLQLSRQTTWEKIGFHYTRRLMGAQSVGIAIRTLSIDLEYE